MTKIHQLGIMDNKNYIKLEKLGLSYDNNNYDFHNY